jgi:hypothetical protein
MREICQSGSMSGNRKQNHAKPDCGDAAKAKSINHRETKVTAPVLDSTLHNAQNRPIASITLASAKPGDPHRQSFEICSSILANLVKPLFRRFSA